MDGNDRLGLTFCLAHGQFDGPPDGQVDGTADDGTADDGKIALHVLLDIVSLSLS